MNIPFLPQALCTHIYSIQKSPFNKGVLVALCFIRFHTKYHIKIQTKVKIGFEHNKAEYSFFVGSFDGLSWVAVATNGQLNYPIGCKAQQLLANSITERDEVVAVECVQATS